MRALFEYSERGLFGSNISRDVDSLNDRAEVNNGWDRHERESLARLPGHVPRPRSGHARSVPTQNTHTVVEISQDSVSDSVDLSAARDPHVVSLDGKEPQASDSRQGVLLPLG